MNYIIVDTEFNRPRYSKLKMQEIIEIGAVKLNDKLQNIGAFRMFVNPYVYSCINRHVEKITNITEEDLKYTLSFSSVLKHFRDWVNESEEHIYCCWGIEDIKEMGNNCRFYKISANWFKPWCNIQQKYMEIYNLQEKPSLKSVVEKHDIKIDDPFHRALNDAFYTAKVFTQIYDHIKPDLVKISEKLLAIKKIDMRQIQIDITKINCTCPSCETDITYEYKGLIINNTMNSIGICDNCKKHVLNNTFVKEDDDKNLIYTNIAHNISYLNYQKFKSMYLNKNFKTCVRRI